MKVCPKNIIMTIEKGHCWQKKAIEQRGQKWFDFLNIEHQP
jgi:hypothetical protein